jgi:preprotein translocase subunit SecA
MFGQMMASVDDDYVKYAMHTQVQVVERPSSEPALERAQYSAPEGPVLGTQAIAGALLAGPVAGEEVAFASGEPSAGLAPVPAPARAVGPAAAALAGSSAAARAATSKTASTASAFDHAGRNDPCPCGSGKKFKFCHGKQ